MHPPQSSLCLLKAKGGGVHSNPSVLRVCRIMKVRRGGSSRASRRCRDCSWQSHFSLSTRLKGKRQHFEHRRLSRHKFSGIWWHQGFCCNHGGTKIIYKGCVCVCTMHAKNFIMRKVFDQFCKKKNLLSRLFLGVGYTKSIYSFNFWN